MLFVPPVIPSMIPEVFAVQDKGDFKLVYYKTDNYTDYEKWIISTNYFETQVDWLNKTFKLPYDVTVGIGECGAWMNPENAVNAYYDPNQKEIIYCYELMELHYEVMDYLRLHGYEFASSIFCKPIEPNCTKFNPPTADRTQNVIDTVFYHEIGHAVIDIFDLPIPAAHEDNADGASAYILLEFTENGVGNEAIRDAAWEYFLLSSVEGLEFSDYADEHSLNIQRFFNLACFAYGSDPSSNRDLITAGLLPQDRAERCSSEYKQLVSSWDKLLEPYTHPATYTPTPAPTPAPTPTPTPTPTTTPIPTPTPTPTLGSQYGTISAETTTLEIPYSTGNQYRPVPIEIFGNVDLAAPLLNSSKYTLNHVYMTITKPDGSIEEQKAIVGMSKGYYENIIQIESNNIGKYTISGDFRGNYIGTVTFNVVLKSQTQAPTPTSTPTPTPAPTPEPTTTPAQTQIISDSTFKKYTYDNNRFSIEYPDDWIFEDDIKILSQWNEALAYFDDQYDWRTDVQVFWNEDDPKDNRYDSQIFRGIETANFEMCRDYTFAEDGRECSDFKAGDSYIMYTNDNKKVYFVSMTYTIVWQIEDYDGYIINGKEYDVVSTVGIIFVGDSSWELASESVGTYPEHSDEIRYMYKSFSMDPTSTPTPTPTQTPNVVTSDSTFKKYTDNYNRFTIEYPSGWILDSIIDDYDDLVTEFSDKRDWDAFFRVWFYEDVSYVGTSDSNILREIIASERESCNESTYQVDGIICYNYKVNDSSVVYTDENRKAYFIDQQYTKQYSDPNYPGESFMRSIVLETHVGNDVWYIDSEIDTNYLDKHLDKVIKSSNSFKLLQGQSTIPTPTPTPAPTLTVKEVTVFNTVGSSSPGCEINNSCFSPYQVSININDKVTWENPDNSVHTITSGTLSSGPDGVFDSGIIYPGTSFTAEFTYDRTYPYFCMIHPWMEGSVVVGSVSDAEQKIAELEAQQKAAEERIAELEKESGGGCLIATAAFGSEMAPQVQFLRELRDNTVLQTESGTSFMAGFNQFYYSFSPTIADYERENPIFKEVVKLALTPLLASLTLLQYADIDSESEMLGYGIGIILLNIGMYFIAPAILIMKIRKEKKC